MLIAKWQLVGFIHGVMNTDNMAQVGKLLTMDLPLWINTIQAPYLAPLMLMVDMPTKTNLQSRMELARCRNSLIHDKESKSVELRDRINEFFHYIILIGLMVKEN